MDGIKQNREFMKANFKDLDDFQTDQQKQLPQPPLQKSYGDGTVIITLPEVDGREVIENNLYACLKKRRSHRVYTEDNISLNELSFLLWATQGVDEIVRNGYATRRPVPSGGARHPFETYLAVNKVDGLQKGVYRYLPLEHQLVFLFKDEELEEKLGDVTLDQKFVGKSAVTFIWSCIPYRSEWRYHTSAHKTMLLDAGHVCQNLYLASEAINCGTCAIASYDQDGIDEFLGLDGENEFVVYVAPVGKV